MWDYKAQNSLRSPFRRPSLIHQNQGCSHSNSTYLFSINNNTSSDHKSSPLPEPDNVCQGWELFKGRCYMFVNNAMSWSRTQDQWLWLDGSWFYNNTWASQSEDSSNPCLVLNSNALFMVCPNGWMGFQGRCYYHNTDILNWHYADANCASLGANLVSVHSLEEYNFLYQQIAILNGYTWLGGFW
ncbi:hypothetical protein NQZ68_014250 [Dissostichus eleginoides]|nr:hypothetical protein NQZ68_014250 [Dissostichus eleginoides]